MSTEEIFSEILGNLCWAESTPREKRLCRAIERRLAPLEKRIAELEEKLRNQERIVMG